MFNFSLVGAWKRWDDSRINVRIKGKYIIFILDLSVIKLPHELLLRISNTKFAQIDYRMIFIYVKLVFRQIIIFFH